MIKIEIPDKKTTINLPECWEELTYPQFLEALTFLSIYKTTGVSPLTIQVEFLKSLIGFTETKKTFSEEEHSQIISNLSIMAGALDFLFDNGAPNLKFRKWMSPDFVTKSGAFTAPFYEIQNTGADIVLTNISTEQFTDAWEYYRLYLQTNDFRNLLILAAVLYTMPEIYSPKMVADTAVGLSYVSEPEIYAVFLQYKSITDYMHQHPVYGMLFSGSEAENPDKISLGFGGQIYSLAAKGYADINTIAKKPFTEFLALLLDMLINDIRTMSAYEMKPHEIAQKTKLPLETVKRLL